MTLALLFWILMLFCLVFGLWVHRATPWPGGAYNGLLFVLLLVVGWKVFGPPVQ